MTKTFCFIGYKRSKKHRFCTIIFWVLLPNPYTLVGHFLRKNRKYIIKCHLLPVFFKTKFILLFLEHTIQKRKWPALALSKNNKILMAIEILHNSSDWISPKYR